MSAIKKKIHNSIKTGAVICIWREEINVKCVVGCAEVLSDQHLLLSIVSDRFRHDGFAVLRVEDITKIEEAEPIASAMSRQKNSELACKTLDMKCIGTILRSATKAYDAVELKCESLSPEIVIIGQVLTWDDAVARLHRINSNGEWSGEISTVFLDRITFVGFATKHIDACLLVADQLDDG